MTRWLWGTASVLMAASVAGQIAKYRFGRSYCLGFVPLFDVNQEQSVPTFFAVVLLLLAAALLAAISVIKQSERLADAMKWRFLAVFFFLMAMDEVATVHEKLVAPTAALLGDDRPGWLFYAWVVPAGILVVSVGLFCLRFLGRLPLATRMAFILASGVYLAGALGVEMLQGQHVRLHGNDNLVFGMLGVLEEGLEMSGIILFIWALATYLAKASVGVAIGFKSAQ